MFKVSDHPHLVPFDGSFRLADAPTGPDGKQKTKQLKRDLEDAVEELDELQRRLYAEEHHSILLVFQAMDAAGKDSTIRAVMTGVNPAGCQVYNFRAPSSRELAHDFLWRTVGRLPKRGRIGIFNRSYYEEVLVVRVHPQFLDNQGLPPACLNANIWEERFESIRDHEKHLARNGTVILKFWLNVSKDEQKKRFLARIDQPRKNWKFSVGDIEERALWDQYMQAYQETLKATSRPWAPWYAIPADSKPFMRLMVARIVVDSLKQIDPKYPTSDGEEVARLSELRRLLAKES